MSNFVQGSEKHNDDVSLGVPVQTDLLHRVNKRMDRSLGIQNKGFKHIPGRRNDSGNPLYFGANYPNIGWSNDNVVPYENARLSATSYGGYDTNNFNSAIYSANSNNNGLNTYAQGFQGHLAQGPTGLPPHPVHAEVSYNMDEIAYLFVYRYYSLLNSNPDGMYNLYSKIAQISKPDLEGNRVCSMGHSDIRIYYGNFRPSQITCDVKQIEVQEVGAQNMLMVVICGSMSIDEDEIYFTQSVVLSGDSNRTRFHIINDVQCNLDHVKKPAIEITSETPFQEPKERQPATPPQIINLQRMEESDLDSNKIVIFGIPSTATEEIVINAINQKLEQLGNKAKVSKIGLKKMKPQPNRVGGKVEAAGNASGGLYTFIEFDSADSVNDLLHHGLQILGRIVTIKPYRRRN